MNKFARVDDGPIATDTILVLDSTGNIINKLGANMLVVTVVMTIIEFNRVLVSSKHYIIVY
jgi:hypothetical protein